LLVAARSCAINCRYCFRREFPYDSAPVSREAWSESLASVRNDSSIREVILSGGEPLINADATLAWFMEELQAIGHVERLRIHTRLPVVIPQRVTEELVRLLPSSRLRTTVVLHTNHANEVDAEVADAMGRLRSVPNLILLNQSVLLAGVNDSVDALETLSWRLLDCGAVPYYLHQLDRVQGAGHFEVPLDRGRQLITALERKLPGYALPRWVREEPGLPHKQTLFP
jgi:EF-P beta-lysylation protein EpmB